MDAQLKRIQNDFNKVISYSQGIENPQTDELFEDWLLAKRNFIEALGGKLIYEFPTPVNFELGEKEKQLRIDDFILSVQDHWNNYELARYLETEREGFFTNVSAHQYETEDGKIIPKGIKLVKAFKFFESDKGVLTDIQNEASRIIQENKIEGTLCVSVHPLDFLSLSENNYNWRSCHSLDGEYRAGNLSYMVDSSTVVCYLKSAEDETLSAFGPEVKWNSKKWRVLVYFSDNWHMLFAGRQYPFDSEVGLNFILSDLLPKSGLLISTGEYSWTNWNNYKIKSVQIDDIINQLEHIYIPVGTDLVPLDDLVIDQEGSRQFNDVLCSSCYDPLYACRVSTMNLFADPWRVLDVSPLTTKFLVGGDVRCLCCGEGTILTEDSMRCEKCELEYGQDINEYITICDCCGTRMLREDAYDVGDDEMVCSHCYHENVQICDRCGNAYYKTEIVYNHERKQYLCGWCQMEIRADEKEENING